MSNEYFSKAIVGTTPQQLHTVDLSKWLWPYIDDLNSSKNKKEPDFSFSPNPVKNNLTIVTSRFPSQYFIMNASGKIIMNGTIDKETTSIDVKELSKGIYFLKTGSENGPKLKVNKK